MAKIGHSAIAIVGSFLYLSRLGPSQSYQTGQPFSSMANDSVSGFLVWRLGVVMLRVLRGHWQEYLIEAAGLGVFMISACAFTVLLMHPASPAQRWIVSGFSRRMVIGVAMGL